VSGAAAAAAARGVAVIPRAAMFRFGDWVYAGAVDFPVDALRLGDVPFVLPALQKQQGRLAFLSEAKAFPSGALRCSAVQCRLQRTAPRIRVRSSIAQPARLRVVCWLGSSSC
jgi:hypothetical protein